jgi:hypothetical protein
MLVLLIIRVILPVVCVLLLNKRSSSCSAWRYPALIGIVITASVIVIDRATVAVLRASGLRRRE